MSERSLTEDLRRYSSGDIGDVNKFIQRMNHWKEDVKKPYQIKLIYQDTELKILLPLSIGRKKDSMEVIARDGSGTVVQITQDSLVSRFLPSRPGHALVYSEENIVKIKDLGSVNGTKILEKTLKKDETAVLSAGDHFTIGNSRFDIGEIVSEIKVIKESEENWHPFKYNYLDLLDRIVDDNKAQVFIERLKDFREEFSDKYPVKTIEDLDKFIQEATIRCTDIITGEIKKKWYNVFKLKLGKV